MTTKPRAKKFRIRRSSSDTATNPVTPGTSPRTTDSPGQPVIQERPNPARASTENSAGSETGTDTGAENAAKQNLTTKNAKAEGPATTGEVSSSGETSPENDIDSIRREGLTGRQLRMARRVAQKHKLPATSDFDAVRLLRNNGIDPFKRSNMLELVVPRGADGATGAASGAASDKSDAAGKVQLPQTVPIAKQTLPSTELSPSERRTREISEIQREISQRRQRKMVLLLTRISFFVLLPTLMVGWYFSFIATPMYSSKAEFLIIQADAAGGGGMGGLLSGTQFATNTDAIATQRYLQSLDVMIRLDQEVGYKEHFLQDWIDPIQRLNDDPTNEETYKTYTKNTMVGYDPTEGIIRMEVSAADPESAAYFATQLISYAEDQVNSLSQKKRGNQMEEAVTAFEKAQVGRRSAQEDLVNLQLKGAILDPEGVIATLRGQINNIEIQLQEKGLQLAALEDNSRPNKAKVDGVSGDIRRLNDLLKRLNSKMIDASHGENSLAQLSVRIQMAQADLVSRDMMLQMSLQQVETARMEANRLVRYLAVSVSPVVAQEPSYPRKFENTVLAFLIFSGIYLMMSLTASILREQVTT